METLSKGLPGFRQAETHAYRMVVLSPAYGECAARRDLHPARLGRPGKVAGPPLFRDRQPHIHRTLGAKRLAMAKHIENDEPPDRQFVANILEDSLSTPTADPVPSHFQRHT